jgi:hypothetical protein
MCPSRHHCRTTRVEANALQSIDSEMEDQEKPRRGPQGVSGEEQRCKQSRQLASKAIGASVLANKQGKWVLQLSKGEVVALLGSLGSLSKKVT